MKEKDMYKFKALEKAYVQACGAKHAEQIQKMITKVYVDEGIFGINQLLREFCVSQRDIETAFD